MVFGGMVGGITGKSGFSNLYNFCLNRLSVIGYCREEYLNISEYSIIDTMDLSTATAFLHKTKEENAMLKMRLVKIMIILENVKKTMERSKDAIIAQLSETGMGLPED